jgi:ferric-dicitrate binding protein FerR (iron transport regulator)
MPHHVSEQNSERSRRAAALYLLMRDDLSLRVFWKLVIWLLRSRHNVREIIQIRRQDEMLARAMLSNNAVQQATSNVTYVNWHKGPLPKSDDVQLRHNVVGWSLAAASAVAIPFTVYLAVSEPSSETWRDSPHAESSYAIATSVDSFPKTERLPDGTTATLEAGTTALRVNFTDKYRNVHLLEGRTTVQVAEDSKRPKRPFVLRTYLASVTAASTELPRFAVSIDTMGMEVEVYAGEVEILRRGKVRSQAIKLNRGAPVYRIPIEGAGAVAANDALDLPAVAPKG